MKDVVVNGMVVVGMTFLLAEMIEEGGDMMEDQETGHEIGGNVEMIELEVKEQLVTTEDVVGVKRDGKVITIVEGATAK